MIVSVIVWPVKYSQFWLSFGKVSVVGLDKGCWKESDYTYAFIENFYSSAYYSIYWPDLSSNIEKNQICSCKSSSICVNGESAIQSKYLYVINQMNKAPQFNTPVTWQLHCFLLIKEIEEGQDWWISPRKKLLMTDSYISSWSSVIYTLVWIIPRTKSNIIWNNACLNFGNALWIYATLRLYTISNIVKVGA